MLKPYSEGLAFIPDSRGADDVALLRFPIVFREDEKRDLVLSALLRQGLGATGSFPVPLNELEGAAPHINSPQSGFPNAKVISQRILTLPLHRYVKRDDIAAMGRIFSSVPG
jgi:dTDP-4-amino-4,6-dideoxygalactose transaminase